MNVIRYFDKVAYGLMIAGALRSVQRSLTNQPSAGPFGKSEPQTQDKAVAALLVAAVGYKLFRLVGPKTKEEKRMIKAAELYRKANIYRKRADMYRHSADVFFKKRIKGSKQPLMHNLKPHH